jgi:triacylglycerol lipase
MTFRPSRRQMLTSLFLSMAAGLAAPFISPQDVLAHSYSQAALKARQATSYNPATNLQPISNTRQNTYPIIMVHGLGGFVTLGPINYWGGVRNVPADLASNGYTVYPINIGTFSSNWDRACELYAQIKGGTVDYGEVHASKYGHTRYGRTYSGFYPQWGETDAQTGNANKVHLLSHSMGGQTVRILAQLLANGSAEERAATRQGQLSPLFAGGKVSWLEGILTISATHNGSSAIFFVNTALPLQTQLLTLLAAVEGDTSLELYDLKLDQWGLEREPGESLSAFMQRVANSKFATTTDNYKWDLNPDGAGELNGWAMAHPENYYLSVATLQAHKSLLSDHQVPDADMTPFLVPTSTFMGEYTRNIPGHVIIDSSWWPNDSLVSLNEMAGPTVNSTDVIVQYNGGVPARGQWNYLEVLQDWGHVDIIGLTGRDVRSWYRSAAAFLASLPQ